MCVFFFRFSFFSLFFDCLFWCSTKDSVVPREFRDKVLNYKDLFQMMLLFVFVVSVCVQMNPFVYFTIYNMDLYVKF